MTPAAPPPVPAPSPRPPRLAAKSKVKLTAAASVLAVVVGVVGLKQLGKPSAEPRTVAVEDAPPVARSQKPESPPEPGTLPPMPGVLPPLDDKPDVRPAGHADQSDDKAKLKPDLDLPLAPPPAADGWKKPDPKQAADLTFDLPAPAADKPAKPVRIEADLPPADLPPADPARRKPDALPPLEFDLPPARPVEPKKQAAPAKIELEPLGPTPAKDDVPTIPIRPKAEKPKADPALLPAGDFDLPPPPPADPKPPVKPVPPPAPKADGFDLPPPAPPADVKPTPPAPPADPKPPVKPPVEPPTIKIDLDPPVPPPAPPADPKKKDQRIPPVDPPLSIEPPPPGGKIGADPLPPVEKLTPPAPVPPKDGAYDEDLHAKKAGDTFVSLSRLYYNGTEYDTALQAYNRDNPIDPTYVRVPPIWVLEKKYASLVGRGVKPVERADKPPAPVRVEVPAPPPFEKPREYVVKNPAGEMLARIAEQQLGDKKAWRRLAELNPDVEPADVIPAGTKLRLP